MELVPSFDNCTLFTFDNIQTNNDDDDLLHMMNTYYFIYLWFKVDEIDNGWDFETSRMKKSTSDLYELVLASSLIII